MRTALSVGVFVVILAAIVVIVGLLLPVKHRTVRAATFRASPEQIFVLITTPENFAKWRTGVRRVDMLSSGAGPQQYREVTSDGTILYSMVRVTPNREVTSEIADRTLPFGGRWTFELTLLGADSTVLRITEDGEVYNPVFRFVSRFIIGHAATIDRYLKDVGRQVDGTAAAGRR